jgi:hypothetical protein
MNERSEPAADEAKDDGLRREPVVSKSSAPSEEKNGQRRSRSGGQQQSHKG